MYLFSTNAVISASVAGGAVTNLTSLPSGAWYLIIAGKSLPLAVKYLVNT